MFLGLFVDFSMRFGLLLGVLRHTSSSEVDVSGWCASSHLSLFTILLKASEPKDCAVFGSGFDPSSDCFDAVLFFTVLSMLGSSCSLCFHVFS